MTTEITIEMYVGNLLCGLSADQLVGLDQGATIESYKAQVQAALAPEYSVAWKTHNGEGLSARIYDADNSRMDDDEDDASVILNIMGDVYSQSDFWSFD